MKKKIIPITISFYFIILLISIFANSVQASNTFLYPNKDSYVNSYEPNKNFGERINMECGTFYVPMTGTTFFCEAYICFDLSEIDLGWKKVEISLKFNFFSNLMDFDLYEVVENWEESSISWSNRPSLGKDLLSFRVEYDSEIIIDISSHLSESELSICIVPFHQYYQVVNFSSREHLLDDYKPQLMFYYYSVNYNPFQIFMGGIIACSTIGLIIWAMLYQKAKGEKIFQEKTNQKKMKKLNKLCSSCGYINTSNTKFCYKCGIKLG
ncbi:MAG: DNRLRE domain-containing protein [Promethearchaeota archaeon]